MSKVNYAELNSLLVEYNSLSNKSKHTKEDERRMAYLQTAISAVKNGATIADVQEARVNDVATRNGLPTINRSGLTLEEEQEARSFKAIFETRDMVQGAPMLSHIGTVSGLGHFVPNNFYPSLFRALKAHDILFDDDACTVLKTDNGAVLPVPVAGDAEIVASVIGESSSRTSTDISSANHAVVGAYSYSTPRFVFSRELSEDMSGAFSISKLAKAFFADRIMRGVGADLLVGNGVNKPKGLITTLESLVTPVAATGSSNNTGGAETGANSIGTTDLANLLDSLDSAYLSSAKTAWCMNRKTLGYLTGLVSKMGTPIDICKYVNGKPYIFGVPVKISPSMDDIGASKVPVILGDFSYWVTRLVNSENLGLTVIREAPGLVENGNVGVVCFFRADGALAFSDTGSPAPFSVLQCHS
jgi:HK97 family phage major capsid protein